MFGIGFQELLVILVIALIIFGPKKLPELARLIGKGMAEFRRAVNDIQTAVELDEIKKDDLYPHKPESEKKPDEETVHGTDSMPPAG